MTYLLKIACCIHSVGRTQCARLGGDQLLPAQRVHVAEPAAPFQGPARAPGSALNRSPVLRLLACPSAL